MSTSQTKIGKELGTLRENINNIRKEKQKIQEKLAATESALSNATAKKASAVPENRLPASQD